MHTHICPHTCAQAESWGTWPLSNASDPGPFSLGEGRERSKVIWGGGSRLSFTWLSTFVEAVQQKGNVQEAFMSVWEGPQKHPSPFGPFSSLLFSSLLFSLLFSSLLSLSSLLSSLSSLLFSSLLFSLSSPLFSSLLFYLQNSTCNNCQWWDKSWVILSFQTCCNLWHFHTALSMQKKALMSNSIFQVFRCLSILCVRKPNFCWCSIQILTFKKIINIIYISLLVRKRQRTTVFSGFFALLFEYYLDTIIVYVELAFILYFQFLFYI